MWSLEQQYIEQAGIIRLCHYISLLINYVDNLKHNLCDFLFCWAHPIITAISISSSLWLVSLSLSHTLFVPRCGIFCIYRCPPGCTISWDIKIKSVEINIQHS